MSQNDYYLDQVKQCVSFIFKESSNGKKQPIGTGFLIGHIADNIYNSYLVTAKHVLQTEPGKFHDKIHVRLNTRNSLAEYLEIDLSKNVILTHPDETVDLAAFFVFPDPNKYEYLVITEDFFTNSNILKEKNIREGSNIFFAGLYPNFYGKQRNYPILRFGRISLMTDEKIEIQEKGQPPKLTHLYIVECQSLGGFSGAPVYFELNRISSKGLFSSPEVYLGGVMKGHYKRDVVEIPRQIIHELNAGLGFVTPCYLLDELLNTEMAIKDRKERPAG